jgi:hypothetical protein
VENVGSSAWTKVLPPLSPHSKAFHPAQCASHYTSTIAIQEPRYVAISQRNQAELAGAIPAEWRLPAYCIPEGMLSPAESITEGPKRYSRVNVIDILGTCRLLTPKELEITEKYDMGGPVAEIIQGRLKAEEVVRSSTRYISTMSLGTQFASRPLA